MKKRIVVLQEEISDCGVCSLLSIIKYYGGMANLEELRIDSNTTYNGVNAFNLINCAKKYGLDAKGYKSDDITKVLLPCIAHLKLSNNLLHFVVIYEISNSKVLIMDPAKGLINMTLEDFNNIYTGFIIELYPKNNLVKYKTKNILRNTYKTFLINNKYKILCLLFLSIINLLLTILSSYYPEIRIKHEYIYLPYLFIIFELIKSLTSYKFEYNSKILDNSISNELQHTFLSFIFKLPLNYIHLKKNGELLSRFEELESVRDFLNNLVISLCLNSISFICLVLILFYYNPVILIPIILFMLISLIISIIFGNKLAIVVKDNIETHANYKNELVDTICGLTSINHNNVYSYFKKKIENSYNDYLNSSTKLVKESNKYKEILFFLSQTLIIILNTILIHSLDEIIKIVFLNYIILYLLNNFNSLINLIPIYYYIKSYLRKCNDLLDIDFIDESNNKYISGDITFKNVYFSYNHIDNVLSKINLTIFKKEKIILKGSSGSGKSTICKLLIKELNNYEGNILIANQELKNINREELRKNIIYVSQEEHIYINTIRNNITLGRNIDEKEFTTICNICALDNIITKRPFGYETYLIGGGDELSGGEKARIILARALVSNYDIYIFDETLAEVNPKMEIDIINKLFTYLKDKTVIYITHKNINYPGILVNI